jgi:hypothetical protein
MTKILVLLILAMILLDFASTLLLTAMMIMPALLILAIPLVANVFILPLTVMITMPALKIVALPPLGVHTLPLPVLLRIASLLPVIAKLAAVTLL